MPQLAAAALAVCAVARAQMLPSFSDAAATVTQLSGDVSVLKDSQSWVLNIGDTVQVKQVIVTGRDGYAKFEVSDGSTFEVFANSTVVFRKNPPNWRDLLDLLVGRVKVHIQRWANQPNPNRIYTPTAIISVRGTTFDVSVDDDDESTTVAVEEGQVLVRHALRGGQERTVNQGETLRVSRDEPIARSTIDRGALAQRVFRMLEDAAYTALTNSRGAGGIGGLGGGSTSGNTKAPTPPPPPPPPPPAPPPPAH